MSGVEGLGRLATTGHLGPDTAGLRRALDHLGRHVDRENVLAARAVLLHEAAQLDELLRQAALAAINAPTVRVPRQAGRPATTPLPTTLDRARSRMDALNRAAARLADTAAELGVTPDAVPTA